MEARNCIRITVFATLAFFLTATPQLASAAEEKAQVTGIYIGAGAGLGLWDGSVDEDEGSLRIKNGDAFAWRVNAWWRLHELFSVELAFIDAGRTGNSKQSSGGEEPEFGRTSVDGFNVSLAPTFSLNRVSDKLDGLEVMGKVGVYLWDGNGAFEDGSEDLSYGVALTYDLGIEGLDGVGLRFDWDRFELSKSNVEADIDILTLGVYVHFPT